MAIPSIIAIHISTK